MKNLIQKFKENKALAFLGIFVVLFIVFAAVAIPYATSNSVSLKSGLHSVLVAGSFVSAEGDGGGESGGGSDGGGDSGGGSPGGGDTGGGPTGGGDNGGGGGGGETPPAFIPAVITPLAPTCVIFASPTVITAGEPTRLTWSSRGVATAMTIAPFGGAFSINDTSLTYPTRNTTYTATVSGPGGTSSCFVNVDVNAPVPVFVPTPTPAQQGTVHIRATLDGQPWSGTATISYRNNPCNQVSIPFDEGVPPGSIPYSYCSGGPSGANFTSITPAATQTVPNGGSATWTFVFVTPQQPQQPPQVPQGTVHIRATLDGAPWSGTATISYRNNPCNAVSIPFDEGVPPGTIPYSYCSGGPGGRAAFVGITPSATQTVVNGGSATWTFNFATLPLPPGPPPPLFIPASPIQTQTQTQTQIVNVTGGGSTQPVIAAPTCTLSANPTSIVSGNGSSLSWTSTNATSVSISGLGSVGLNGNTIVSPTITTTYIGTVSGPGGTITCSAPVTVTATPVSLRCDLFSASPSPVNRGDTSTLRWNTTGATNVTINNGVGSVSINGSTNVQVQNDTTYTLTAQRGNETTTCSTSVSIQNNNNGGGGGGGGGGGRLPPRCELFNASNANVIAGDRVTLNWSTRFGDALRIEDDRNNEIVNTRNSNDVNASNVVVRPVRSTRYTLIVDQGGRNDTCVVFVNVGNQNVALISNRDQQPLTSISLTQVPYTGFDAGPILTSVFYTILGLWAASVAYVLVIKKGAVFGYVLRGRGARVAATAMAIPQAAYQSPAAYRNTYEAAAVASSMAAAMPPSVAMPAYETPANLPTGAYGAFGSTVATEDEPIETESREAHLEAYAHKQNVILSNDAIRLITDHATVPEEQDWLLGEVITRAKDAYPREDGWTVLNSERLTALF